MLTWVGLTYLWSLPCKACSIVPKTVRSIVIGHGQLKDEQGREVGQLALVDRQLEDGEWIDANEFSLLFAQHRPGIVVLQACEGGAISASQAFAGVASRVVQVNGQQPNRAIEAGSQYFWRRLTISSERVESAGIGNLISYSQCLVLSKDHASGLGRSHDGGRRKGDR